MRRLLVAFVWAGCGGDLGPGCEDPGTWYPDVDGDGLGEPSSAYFGCAPPEGWVTGVDTAATPTDTAATPTDTAATPTDTAVSTGSG